MGPDQDKGAPLLPACLGNDLTLATFLTVLGTVTSGTCVDQHQL